jgi:hypothetical protein
VSLQAKGSLYSVPTARIICVYLALYSVRAFTLINPGRHRIKREVDTDYAGGRHRIERTQAKSGLGKPGTLLPRTGRYLRVIGQKVGPQQARS